MYSRIILSTIAIGFLSLTGINSVFAEKDPPPPPPRIIDIHPIQVVQKGYETLLEPIAMVKNKLTMVRVFVKSPPNLNSGRIRCELSWNGTIDKVSGLLIQRNGRTIVTSQSNNSHSLGRKADWAFNFLLPGTSAPIQYGRKMPANLILVAKLYKESDNSLLDMATERSGGHFKIRNATQFKVHVTTGMFNNVRPFTPAQSVINVAGAVKQAKTELLALYPLDSAALTVTSDGTMHNENVPAGNPPRDGHEAMARRLWGTVYNGQNYDAIIVLTGTIPRAPGVVTPGTTQGLTFGNVGNVDHVHFIDWPQYAYTSIAHEIAHQDRFVGAIHQRETVKDAWDAGAHFSSPGKSKDGKQNLVFPGGTSGIRTKWINSTEYSKLLSVLTQ